MGGMTGIGGMSGMQSAQASGSVGVKALKAANQAQMDVAARLLKFDAAENMARAGTEAKGMFVDRYA